MLNQNQEIEIISKALHQKYGAVSLITEDTAEAISVHPQTLKQNRTKKIGLPYSKIGNSVRYSIFDIAKYLVSNKVKVS